MSWSAGHQARSLAPRIRGRRLGRSAVALVTALALSASGPAGALASVGPADVPPPVAVKAPRSTAGPQQQASAAVLVKTKSPKATVIATSRAKGLAEADWTASAKPDELVVTVASRTSKAGREALSARIARADGQVRKTSRDGMTMLVGVPRGRSRQAYATTLARDGAVGAVQPNYRYEAEWVPNDPLYSSQWGLPRTGCPAAWDVTRGSADIVVAVIDTGVDLTHPDLAGRIDTTNDKDYVNLDDSAQDDEGHGTHVAGTVAATTDNGSQVAGVAPSCTILPIKVLDSRGSGLTFDVAQGIDWAGDHGADVINLSLGGGPSDALLAEKIAHVQSVHDVVVVAAAGNSGSSSGAMYPARYPGVLGVAATTDADAWASFSNYGTGIDIAAPGVDILSTTLGGGTGYNTGTSMASPHVAGVAALVRTAYPLLSQSEVAQRLTSTAWDLEPAGPDAYFGAGLVRADSAVGGAAIPPATDDNIPGVPLPAPSASGTLAAGSDTDDVYKVYLNAGQQLDVSLTGDGGTDFDLYVYAPDASDVGTSPWAATDQGGGYPEQVSVAVTMTGYHYVDIRAASGAGSYTATWSVTTPGAEDDNIPGVVASASPILGSLARGVDNDDVFKVNLAAGERIALSVTASAGTDFDLYLFDPTATDVNLGTGLIAYSFGTTYPEQVVYTAVTSGDHYIDVYAYSGAGAYTLTWSKAAGPPDDNIPGVPIPASPVDSTLTTPTDIDDVYRVYLTAGQQITLSLTGDDGTDFDLYLFGPSATDVNTSPWLERPWLATYPEQISYTATETGYHYVDVYLYYESGSGGYSLTWSVTSPADDNIPGVDAPASPVSGSLTAGSDMDDVYRVYATAGQQITLSLTGDDGTDFDLYLFGPSATDVNTSPYLTRSILETYPEQISYTAATTGYHYVDVYDWSGSGAYVLGWSVQTPPPVYEPPPPETAPVVTPTTSGTLYTPVAPSTVYYGRTFTMYGFLKPRHTAGLYSVKLEGYRYERQSNGTYKWVRRATWYAKNANYSTYTKYIKAGNLKLRGRWRFRAVHTHTGYLPKYSGYRYFYVR